MDRAEAETIYDSGPSACVKVLLALANQVERLEGRVERLEEELRELRRDPENSSLPPSADPRGGKRGGKRKRSDRKPGGQPGHPGSGRGLAPIERVDEVIEHLPELCGECGHSLADRPARGPIRRHQVAELPEIAVRVSEHRLCRRRCPDCGAITQAELPPEVPRERFGARLQGGRRHPRRRLSPLAPPGRRPLWRALRPRDRHRYRRCDRPALRRCPARAPRAALRCGSRLPGGLRR